MNRYNRTIEAVTKCRDHIRTINPNATIGLISILHQQGEYNYTGSNGGTQDYTKFKELTKNLNDDLNTDIAFGLLDNTQPAAFVTYQTGAGYTRDNTKMAIGMAQLDMSNEVNNCILASPIYYVTDKGGHTDANGQRWIGMQFGKVLHRLLDRGIDWKPLQPIKAVFYGEEIFIPFLVPHPPLIFKPAHNGVTAYNPATKGFRVTDDNGDVTIISVNIVGSALVSVKLSRSIVGVPYVWYAPQTVHNGNGNICDSDPTIAPYNYEYQTGTGQYPAANIPELVNKPYPLNNFSVAFRIAAETYSA